MSKSVSWPLGCSRSPIPTSFSSNMSIFVVEPRSMARKFQRHSGEVHEWIILPIRECHSHHPDGERTLFNCCQVHLNPESICSLAHFSDFSFWQSRAQTVATAMNATGRVQMTPHRTHTRALLLAAHTTCDSHVWLKILTVLCV